MSASGALISGVRSGFTALTRSLFPGRHRLCFHFRVSMLPLLVAAPVSAAHLTVVDLRTPEGLAKYVLLTGDIEVGDWWRFVKLLQHTPQANGVLLHSDGGSLDDGLAIAKHVFEHRLSTMVGESCHSVCTIIFLAGSHRYITANAALTVHSAYKQAGNWIVEDDRGNSAVAWFIGYMGYPLPIARLWAETPSTKSAPITLELNETLRLGFTEIPASATSPCSMESSLTVSPWCRQAEADN